nr:putative reverse transcriptase domain-containing protein [Tanacetum cinerariifolium]
MKLYMRIVLDKDLAIDDIPLATKPPVIVEYKIVKEGKIRTYHITRADRSIKIYTSMINLLENIDREYLEALWKLVKDKRRNRRPKEGYERVLWGDLKVMFEPDIESEVWGQLQGYDVTVWKLFSSSGVHFVRFKNLYIFMLVDKAYPLTSTTITKMLERKLQADQWGLPRSIEGNVTASKPKTLEEAITITQRIEGKKPSRLMSPPQLRTMGMLETFPYVEDVSYTTQDLAQSSVIFATRNQCPKANNSAHGRAYLLRDKNARRDPNVVTVSPQKGVIRFGKRGKLNPWYIGPFKILDRIGPVAYKLELHKELSNVHSTFHVSNLKKCLSDESLVIPMKELQLDEKLNSMEELVEIMDREVKQLKRSHIPIIKVRWNSKRGPEFTWEREDQIRATYLHFFPNITPTSN